MEFLATLLAQLGRGRALVIGAVGLALVIGLVMLALRPSSAGLAYLYTDLDPSSAQAISEKLKAQNIEFQLSADGTAILAPQDRLAELRMTLAGEQLGGKIGYEVLDAEQPFGMSAAREKMNETRAIEGELARSISTLQAVSAARVHIVMPDKAIFAREERKASAAVTVKTRSRLSGENIEAIRSLVAAAVPELSPEAVSIIDAQGRLLARAGEAGSAGGQEIDERQLALEQRLRGQIEQLLEPIVGAGKVRAEVSAELDRAQKREEARMFDPDAQVISRQISVESGNQNQESQAGDGGVTVGNQLPTGGASGPASGGTQTQSRANETSEDVTYDNSRTDTVTATGPGSIKRLSVAVSIDPGAKKSLPADQMQKLTRLVENAVGYDAERGDSVVVEAMPFTPTAEEEGAGLDIMRYVPTAQILPMLELLLVAGVGLMVLRIVRSGGGGDANGSAALLSGRRAADTMEPDANGDTMLPALEGDPALPAPPSLANPSHMAALDQEIALAQVEGGIKASSLKRIGETIASNPAESASVIRQWMNA
ncbi:flagellar basal-body MS-ring/collar protein FliF [Sphingobium fluviale]|uniref:flagellar basal-body MS-ring/collar protein FliF n=1 Tax=Sphingobium fluviale TaxID=2506423 RepID=UPI001FE95ACA|nr:flagellar basal-body MS-ring/collar protein FliF [Sphingobium fluviale]